MPIVRCRRCGSPTSGFAPRCAECGAWRRVLGRADGESTEWRRLVTSALAVIAVTIAYLDLRQLHRSEWSTDADASAPPPAAGAGTTQSARADASAPMSAPQPIRAASVQRVPGASSASAALASQRPAGTYSSSDAVPHSAGGSASGSASAESRGSMASAFADWFQRVALGHGRDAAIARDSTDSISVTAGTRTRSGPSGESSSQSSQSPRWRDATQRSVRNALRATNPR